MMFYRVFHSDSKTMYTSMAMLVVSLLFVVVGVSRWVEFLDFNFSKWRRSVLIGLHLVGCVLLGLAFAVQAIDLDRKLSNIGMALITSAFVLLFPIHIYIGLLRRIRNHPKKNLS